MIAGDDQPSALGRQLAGEVERPLLADRLDHALAEGAAGQLLDGADDGGVVVHQDGLGGAEGARDIERIGTARDGDHPRAGVRREPCQDRAEKADADDRDSLPGGDVAAAKNVHGAAERLARERLVGERGGEGHHGLGRGDVVFGIGLVRERRDAFADAQPLDAVAERVDRAPGLVPEGARLGREGHPVRPGPGRQVRGAHPAALQPQAHLPGAGHGARHLVDADAPGPGEDRRPHRAGRSAHDAMPPTLSYASSREL